MVHNRVTPNLLMLFLLVGGFFMATRIKQEVFPEFDVDMVTVRVPYPGASPEEVEQGIVLVIEENVRAIDGVKEVTAIASEGRGTVNIELLEGANAQKVYQEIQQAVDRIVTFPEDAERAEVSLEVRRREVLDLILYGDASEWDMRNLAEEVRDRLLQDKRITQVDLDAARPYEVHIEVPEDALRAYGLTLNQIAARVGATSVEVPGGGLKTAGGELLVRFKERREWAEEFARLPIITTAAGAVVQLGDIATIRDGFMDVDREAAYNSHRAITLEVYRIGQETPVGISTAVHDAMEEIGRSLPEGIHYTINNDMSEIYQQRLELLLKNAFMGLGLVLLLLGLFLEFKLAFWVTMGIPTSFLGALLFLPGMDVTINMISMFAFIVALGIVVDDAIVAGENIYECRQRGMSNIEAAIQGAKGVATPVAFSILTNIVAFIPLYFIPGMFGKIWKVIPLVVITTFLISWLESVFILPSHLAHTRSRPRSGVTAWLHHRQQAFSAWFLRMVDRIYGPFVHACLRHRFLTLSVALAILTLMAGYIRSGRLGFILMPRVESDSASVTATLPYGSPLARTAAVRDRLIQVAEQIASANGGDRLVKGIRAVLEENTAEVVVYLTPPEERPMQTAQFARQWRERTGQIAGVQSLQFSAERGGPGGGPALTVELSHRDISVLDQASAALAARVEEFPNVKDVDDGYNPGKQQFDFKLKPEGRSLGLTSQEVARQIRSSFYGAEALRQQRGRNEVKVMVRLPEKDRRQEFNLENLLIRTPAGTDVPLMQIAEVGRGRAYTSIQRRNGRRTVSVTADVEPIGETPQVQAALDATVLPQLAHDYPGLTYGYEGRQADMADSMKSLYGGLLLALLAIYFLLAVPFRSYTQPFIVMASIPFGIVGAVLGHILMGYNLSVMSMMGIIALSGVVVNDSLVLINYANQLRDEGQSLLDAVCNAGIRRFRPILLTTLTTFGGLAPMIFETSRQARFMIPMAISLGYGILFATVISLVIVPCLYLMVEDVKRALGVGRELEEPRSAGALQASPGA
jgi:multidrug efflux pump subunit AcrB